MSDKKYFSNWLSNISVGTFVVGGFSDMSLSLKFFALFLSFLALFGGKYLNKKEREAHQ